MKIVDVILFGKNSACRLGFFYLGSKICGKDSPIVVKPRLIRLEGIMTRRRNTKDCEFLTALFLRWLIWAMVIVVSAQVAGAASYESSGQNFKIDRQINKIF